MKAPGRAALVATLGNLIQISVKKEQLLARVIKGRIEMDGWDQTVGGWVLAGLEAGSMVCSHLPSRACKYGSSWGHISEGSAGVTCVLCLPQIQQ